MKRNGVDIIIPVYNALEDLKICMRSICEYTDLSLDRVLLIDDCSPDAQVMPYLRNVETDGIVVLQNEQNQGFSGTINRGLRFSDRDVILLNSDTVVTENWVDKLVTCAYSDPAIGTVTPFSNNATLCSVPDFCRENTIPYGLSIAEYAKVIEHASMRAYPRITVAVGFCMFVKREVVDAVGLFDQETFQRGYGEENDFCWRAEQLGYHHVLCDDTYIHHSGTASFLSKEKQKLIESHEQILRDRYPRQLQTNAEYVRDNPHQYLRNNIDLYAQLKNGKKNLLYLLHMDFRPDAENHIGGTQFHVKDLMMHLRDEYNVFVMARDDRMFRLTIYMEGKQISFKFPIGKKPDFQCFHSEKVENVLRQVLNAFEIDLIHVHHVQGLSFDVFHIAHEMEIPVALTLHDYYYICPTVKLLENGSTYCAGNGKNCAGCLCGQMGFAQQVDYLPVWQKKCREALALCQMLITPSEAAKAVYAGVYPEIASKIQVVPHGMDVFASSVGGFRQATPGFACVIEQAFREDYTITGWMLQEGQDSSKYEQLVLLEDTEGNRGEYHSLAVSRPDIVQAKSSSLYSNSGFQLAIPDGHFVTGDLKVQLVLRNGEAEFCSEVMTLSGYQKREKTKKRIAFLGGLNEAKGSALAYQMIKQGGGAYDWYIVGGLGDPNLITLSSKNVRKTGWYQREDVSAILKQNLIDLVCILPIWPETFCYTISEAELAGIPVLATDIGALSERIRRDQTGWLLPHNLSAADALNKLKEIFADETGYARVKQTAERFCHLSIAQMCDVYRNLYAAVPASTGNYGGFDAEMIFNAYAMGEGGGHADQANADLIRQITELEAALQSIHQSLEYRMVKFFNREKMPFKRAIKWMIGFAYRVYVKFKKLR